MSDPDPISFPDDSTRVLRPTPAQVQANTPSSRIASSGPGGDWVPPGPLELSKLIPQFEIELMIGRGGMGAVYKGIQTALDRRVAIKLLPAEIAADKEFVARFQREARTLAKLQHPGIVAVYDFGQTTEGHLYFVMEFVDGTDLCEIVYGRGLTPLQAFEFVGQICEALQYAHEQGVIHRDIKPANVLITKGGRAKLADFGLARPVTDDHALGLTRTNVVMGTPDYMAPEQLAGVVDHRADLYALGVMLYEMLTKQRPRGAWEAPSSKVSVDAQIDQVVVKAMQYDCDKRYQHASEMKTDVDVIKARTKIGKQINAVPGRAVPRLGEEARSGMSWGAIAAAVFAVLGLGAGGFVVWQKSQTPVVVQAAPPPEPPKPQGVPASMARNFTTRKNGIQMNFDADTQTWSSEPKAFDPSRDGPADEWAGQITASEQSSGVIPKHYCFKVEEDGTIRIVPGAPKFLVAFAANARPPSGSDPGTIASPMNGKDVTVASKDWHPGAKIKDPTTKEEFMLPDELPKLVATLDGAIAPQGKADGTVTSPFTRKRVSVALKDWQASATIKCPETGFEFLLPAVLPKPLAAVDGSMAPKGKAHGTILSPFSDKSVPVEAKDWRPGSIIKDPDKGRDFVLPDGLSLLITVMDGATPPVAGAPGSVLSPFTGKPMPVAPTDWHDAARLKDPETALEFLLPANVPVLVAKLEGAQAPKGTTPGSVINPFTGKQFPVELKDWHSNAKLKGPDADLEFLMPADALPKVLAAIDTAVKPKGTKVGSVLSPYSGKAVNVEKKDWHPGTVLKEADNQEFLLPADLPPMTASTTGAKAPKGEESGKIVSPYSGELVSVPKSKWKANTTIHCPTADFDFLLPDDLPVIKEEPAPAMASTPSFTTTKSSGAGGGKIPASMQKNFITRRNGIIMDFDAASGTWKSHNKGVILPGGDPKDFAQTMTLSEKSSGTIPKGFHFEAVEGNALRLVPD